MQLRHHRLHLRAVEHPHQNRFDYIVKMVPKCNFVAAKRLCCLVEMPAPHPRTKIARVLIDLCDRIENTGFKYLNRDFQQLCIFAYFLIIDLVISRIHHQKNNLKRHFGIPLQALHAHCHEHRILAAGDADSDFVALLNQLVFLDAFQEFRPDLPAEFIDNRKLDVVWHFGSDRSFRHTALSPFTIHIETV